MNNEQQLIIDKVYSNYKKNAVVGDVIDSHYEPARDKWNLYNKEEFINFIKTNPEFSEKWGLKIEERELRYEERLGMTPSDIGFSWTQWTSGNLDDFNIPTKLITITYKEQTIESYE